jgi:hypothetical protein
MMQNLSFFFHAFSANAGDVCHVANIVFKRTLLLVTSHFAARAWTSRVFDFAYDKSKALSGS